MKGAVKLTFAAATALLFAIASISVLVEAFVTPGFVPNEAHTFVLDTVGAAIMAFVAAQLGIVVATVEARGFWAKAHAAMGNAKAGEYLLLADALLLLLVGLAFVALWVMPQFIAVPAGDPRLFTAPAYIAARAKAFIGITLAALAGLSTSQ